MMIVCGSRPWSLSRRSLPSSTDSSKSSGVQRTLPSTHAYTETHTVKKGKNLGIEGEAAAAEVFPGWDEEERHFYQTLLARQEAARKLAAKEQAAAAVEVDAQREWCAALHRRARAGAAVGGGRGADRHRDVRSHVLFAVCNVTCACMHACLRVCTLVRVLSPSDNPLSLLPPPTTLPPKTPLFLSPPPSSPSLPPYLSLPLSPCLSLSLLHRMMSCPMIWV